MKDLEVSSLKAEENFILDENKNLCFETIT